MAKVGAGEVFKGLDRKDHGRKGHGMVREDHERMGERF